MIEQVIPNSEFQIFSVPKDDDYLAATLELYGEVEQFGGMKDYLRDYEFRGSSNQSQRIHDHIKSAGEIALRLEPKDDSGIISDRMFMAITHSFKRGLITGTKLTDIVHDGLVQDMYVLQRLDAGIPQNVVRDEDEFYDGADLIEWGYMGLDLIGDDAKSFIDDMANAVYERPEHRALYKMGTGAAILTAYCLIVDHNVTSVTKYFRQSDLSKELGELINATTGE